MKILTRGVVTIVSTVATFYFVFWVGGALILSLPLPPWSTTLVAAVTACVVARYVWMHTGAASAGLVSSIVLGALATGGIGFVAGFFGPMLFMPGANQGPLLGIFITGPLGFLVGAVCGALYWLARGHLPAKVPAVNGNKPPGDSVTHIRQRKRWPAVCASIAVVTVLLVLSAGRYVAPLLPLRMSPIVIAAVDRAGDDPRVAAVLGAPVRARWSVRGYVSKDETGWTESRAWIPVYGPKAEGTIYARAGRGSYTWVFTTVEFRPPQGPSVNLMEAPAATLGPPRGAVYLVHLGPPGSVSLGQLPAYYKTLLGLDVFVLPPIALARDAFNAERGQFAAEMLIGALRQSLPAVALDPAATVIGVLEEDMYAQGLDSRFLFSFRGAGHVALVASRRLAPPAWHIWEGQNRLQTRVRKLITKDIGVVAYGLPLSDDPSSVLFEGIESPSDLDLVQERFDGLGSLAEVRTDVGTHYAVPTAPEIMRVGTEVKKPSGWYPCFLVQPGVAWDGKQPIEARITECLPGLRTDKRYDEFEVDLRAGLLMTRQTDVYVQDVMPLVLTRCYRLWDEQSRAFGLGWNHPYDILPTGTRNPYTFMDLVMPDGQIIHYDRISKGTGYADAVYEHTETATPFLRSEMSWNGSGWDLRFPDGSLMVFPENYGGTKPHHGAPTEIRDSGGHTIRFTRDHDRNLVQLTSPAGHFIRLEHDIQSRVTSATDDTGQVVRYTYDQGGRLISVTSGNRAVQYRYDSAHMVSVEVSGKRTLDVGYLNGQVASLTLPDRRIYRFEYIRLGPRADVLTETIVYAPDGSRTRIKLNPQ